MESVPGIAMRGVQTAATKVSCPKCGGEARALGPGEAVYPAATRATMGPSTQETVTCPGCAHTFTLTVTRAAR